MTRTPIKLAKIANRTQDIGMGELTFGANKDLLYANR